MKRLPQKKTQRVGHRPHPSKPRPSLFVSSSEQLSPSLHFLVEIAGKHFPLALAISLARDVVAIPETPPHSHMAAVFWGHDTSLGGQ